MNFLPSFLLVYENILLPKVITDIWTHGDIATTKSDQKRGSAGRVVHPWISSSILSFSGLHAEVSLRKYCMCEWLEILSMSRIATCVAASAISMSVYLNGLMGHVKSFEWSEDYKGA